MGLYLRSISADFWNSIYEKGSENDTVIKISSKSRRIMYKKHHAHIKILNDIITKPQKKI